MSNIDTIIRRTYDNKRAAITIPDSARIAETLRTFGFNRTIATAFQKARTLIVDAPHRDFDLVDAGYHSATELALHHVLSVFDDVGDAKKTLAPLYAWLRSGIAFRHTNAGIEVNSANGWREVASDVDNEKIAEPISDLADLFRTQRLGLISHIDHDLNQYDFAGHDAVAARAMERGKLEKPWLVTATGVVLYPRDTDLDAGDLIVSSLDMCHRMSITNTDDGDFTQQRTLWLRHDDSAATDPAKLFRALMDEFTSVVPDGFLGLLVLAMGLAPDTEVHISDSGDEDDQHYERVWLSVDGARLRCNTMSEYINTAPRVILN